MSEYGQWPTYFKLWYVKIFLEFMYDCPTLRYQGAYIITIYGGGALSDILMCTHRMNNRWPSWTVTVNTENKFCLRILLVWMYVSSAWIATLMSTSWNGYLVKLVESTVKEAIWGCSVLSRISLFIQFWLQAFHSIKLLLITTIVKY